MAIRAYGKGGVLYFLKDGDSTPTKINWADWSGEGNHVTVFNAALKDDKEETIMVAIADIRDEDGAAVGTQTMRDIIEHLGTEKGK